MFIITSQAYTTYYHIVVSNFIACDCGFLYVLAVEILFLQKQGYPKQSPASTFMLE